MNKKYLLVLLVLVPVILITNISAETTYHPPNNTKFKVFEDGVTYTAGDSGGIFSPHTYINIVYNGTEYDCQPSGYHNNQYLNPVCVEIILRSLP
jgi:hypothetical protein